jgi:hypothetical protein
MPNLLWDTAVSISRSVAATGASALFLHEGSPQAQAYFDARRNLDSASIADALESLATIDPPLADALAAQQEEALGG